MNEIIYWLFFARIFTVHVSAIVMVLIASAYVIFKFRLSVTKSILAVLFAAALHETIFNPVWIIYFHDWTVFNNLQTFYLSKCLLYFAFTLLGFLYFRLNLEIPSVSVFVLVFLTWIMSGLPTSVPLPNFYGNVQTAGNYWEFAYNSAYSIMFATAIKNKTKNSLFYKRSNNVQSS